MARFEVGGNKPAIHPSMVATCAWDALPEHLQERILSLLPLTALLPVAAASRALRRLLRSRAFHSLLTPHRLDAFFLLSPRLAFHPLSRRLLPAPPAASPPVVSSPSHLVTAASLLRLPALPATSYLLAVVLPIPPSSSSSSSCSREFTLVAVTAGARVRSYTLDSADPSPRWDPRGDLPLPFALLGNAAVAGDRLLQLFVLGRGPDALLVFDLATGQWTVLPAAMPLGLTTAHLFVFGGRLFLVAGESFWHFQAADRMGIVCLYNAVDGRLVMFDAADGEWTRLSRVSGLDVEESRRWFGHVVEPRVELLLG
uniref:F-box domain-containing protein n=1 Tax=Oryza barthii TaxID=65489 RepID=A0A0D3EPL0_9ORYZ